MSVVDSLSSVSRKQTEGSATFAEPKATINAVVAGLARVQGPCVWHPPKGGINTLYKKMSASERKATVVVCSNRIVVKLNETGWKHRRHILAFGLIKNAASNFDAAFLVIKFSPVGEIAARLTLRLPVWLLSNQPWLCR